MFESFINGSLKLVDPAGRFQHDRFDDGLNYLRAGGSLKELTEGKIKSKQELTERKQKQKELNALREANPNMPEEKLRAYLEWKRKQGGR